MHLILGHEADSCCEAVAAALAARGCAVRRTAEPMAAPSSVALRIDPDGSATSTFALRDGADDPIESVLVRACGTVDPTGWDEADFAYAQAELHAAMLGWLAALPCPVVNRPDAEAWYGSRRTLLHWRPTLRACGLDAPRAIVSDSAPALADFRRSLEALGSPGAILRRLARDEQWLVGPDDWGGVGALQRRGPVCVSEPHGAATSVCVVGGTVTWGAEPSAAEAALSGRLARFADRAGLAFVELALGAVAGGPAVVHVDPAPVLEHFEPRARARIVEALADLLTERAPARLAEAS